jgi:hypothetical protein
MAAMILGIDGYTKGIEIRSEPIIPGAVFRHTMVYMQDRMDIIVLR